MPPHRKSCRTHLVDGHLFSDALSKPCSIRQAEWHTYLPSVTTSLLTPNTMHDLRAECRAARATCIYLQGWKWGSYGQSKNLAEGSCQTAFHANQEIRRACQFEHVLKIFKPYKYKAMLHCRPLCHWQGLDGSRATVTTEIMAGPDIPTRAWGTKASTGTSSHWCWEGHWALPSTAPGDLCLGEC